MITTQDRLSLPSTPIAASLARGYLLDRVGATLAAERLDDAVLLVSELVANAVVHGSPPITLQVRTAGGADPVRVAVTDASPAHPRILPPNRFRDHGRGVAILDALADRWGVIDRPDGSKTVWFEMAASGVPGEVRTRR